jgi:catechol 2,3-dioxygenase-like lactoylglutathione lyase family enzyme
MFKAITHSAVFVTDQDEALDFYVNKLGLEVAADVDMQIMRWLTVRVPGQPEREILLETPKNPMNTEEDAQEIRDLLGKGSMGLGFILTTDDCHKTYEELKAKGVEFTEEPTERFYGIDAGIRDPFGNAIRLTQPAEVMGEPPETWS